MIKITCTVCGAEMGTIGKDEATPEEQTLYRKMETCPNGHSNATDLVPEDDQDQAAPLSQDPAAEP